MPPTASPDDVLPVVAMVAADLAYAALALLNSSITLVKASVFQEVGGGGGGRGEGVVKAEEDSEWIANR